MSKPRGSSGSWRDRQERDPYVRRSRDEGYRSRAVYKLEEMVDRERLLKRGMLCIDLGAAPGGWSQYVSRRLDGDVEIIALDVLPMDALPGVTFIQGDFREQSVLDELTAVLDGRRADLVMSDMAPNISGVKAVDQPRAMHLAELALELAGMVIAPRGAFVCKLFQGEGFDAYVREIRRSFGSVKIRKPKASRASSNEVYVLARNYRLV